MANLEDIKVGDRVKVQERHYTPEIRTVVRLTPKQIILDGLLEYSRFKRGKPSRWDENKLSYRQIGGTRSRHIIGIATPEECAAWDAKQKQERAKKEAINLKREQEEATRLRLKALFGDMPVYVSCEHDHVVNDQPVEWSVTVYYATEEGVRRLAQMMRAERT